MERWAARAPSWLAAGEVVQEKTGLGIVVDGKEVRWADRLRGNMRRNEHRKFPKDLSQSPVHLPS